MHTPQGILSVADVVTNVGKVPDDIIPPNQMPPEGISVGMGTRTVVSFTNKGQKHKPTPPKQLEDKPLSELTNYIITDRNHEPWNTYILGVQPTLLLKTRTILSKATWVKDCYTELGDPLIRINHSTIHTISNQSAPEGGMQ